MIRLISSARDVARRLRASEGGAVAFTVGLVMTVVIAMAGFVIDIGHAIYVERQLQAATDAAALAGANGIPNSSAIADATSYSALAGDRNEIPGVTVTLVSGYPQLKCLTSTGVTCVGTPSANAIVVKEQAVVPTWFARVVGMDTITVTATSTAGATGGAAKPLDIMLLLDTTASMNTADPSCSIAGATRLGCAKAGAQVLLTDLSIAGDQVGLMTFPGVSAGTAANQYDCNAGGQTVVAYKNNPTYGIIGLGSDFKSSATATTLSTSSNLVRAVGGGGAGCAQGMTAVGGVGTFFADAITAAQSALASSGRPNTQKVIIILSDGDAGANASNMTASEYPDQCQEAINAAGAATAAGTWVYTIAYGAPTSATGSCSSDNPHISACTTMQDMASQASFFYSDTTGGSSTCTSAANPTSDLVSIFGNIGASFGAPRLLPDDTT